MGSICVASTFKNAINIVPAKVALCVVIGYYIPHLYNHLGLSIVPIRVASTLSAIAPASSVLLRLLCV